MTSDTEKIKSPHERPSGLDLLRVPFPPDKISKLPKPTRQQTEAVKNDFKVGIRCDVCGGWHHPKVVHIDYVGHAALTDRLLDADPKWDWEPLAMADDGSPLMDKNGGMWIKLTVCGVTRLGYGHPDGKTGGDAIKETIGDALRNAAMRFGAALDLWHKGDLHGDESNAETNDAPKRSRKEFHNKTKLDPPGAKGKLKAANDVAELREIWDAIPREIQEIADVIKAKDDRKAELGAGTGKTRELDSDLADDAAFLDGDK